MTTRQARAKNTPAAGLVGREVETVVERIVPGGFGLAHALGATIFVALAAPGDRLRVRVERAGGAVGHATIVAILEPSPVRVEPRHPAFVRCGGADFQHLTYEAQLAAKVGIVRDCLRRIGGIDPPTDLPITPSPRQWGYRSRAEWRHDQERGVLGYVEGGTHRVCDVAHDPLAVPELDAALGTLRDRLAAGGLPAAVREVRAAAGDGDVSLAPPLDWPEPATVTAAVDGERYAYDADCFFQVNHGVLEPLVAEALRFVLPPGNDGAPDRGDFRPAIDLYCGAGLFALWIAAGAPGSNVVGVEVDPLAIEAAEATAREWGLGNCRFVARPAERAVGELPDLDLVIVDPPRSGLDEKLLRALIERGPRGFIYVSCEPATLARDLAILAAGGYTVHSVELFDFFPQTYHVESLAFLTKD